MKKPMLASKAKDLSKIKFPVLVSPKLDGFRCTKQDGKALTRSLKPIANDYVRNYIEEHYPDNIDGELMLADEKATFGEISSAFRKVKGEPDFVFYIFDMICDSPFKHRTGMALQCSKWGPLDNPIEYVKQEEINSVEELLAKEAEYLVQGYEGLMIRSIDGPYKHGRSTEKEGYLLKMKQFKDAEAEIIGFEEGMTNNNPKEINELGLSKRSSATKRIRHRQKL